MTVKEILIDKEKELKTALSSPRHLTDLAKELKNYSLFAKNEEDQTKLSQLLHRVWAHTLDEKTLEKPRSEGRRGFESAHQHAVDGFIILIRAGVKREKILAAVKKTAPPSEFKRFQAYLPRLK